MVERVLMVKTSPLAVDDEKLILFVSKKASPFNEKCIDGVVVPIPTKPLAVLTVNTDDDAEFKILKALAVLTNV